MILVRYELAKLKPWPEEQNMNTHAFNVTMEQRGAAAADHWSRQWGAEVKILGHTGLVKIETREEWDRIRAALVRAGFKPMSSKSTYLKDRNGKIVTDMERFPCGGKIRAWFVELDALQEAGIEP